MNTANILEELKVNFTEAQAKQLLSIFLFYDKLLSSLYKEFEHMSSKVILFDKTDSLNPKYRVN